MPEASRPDPARTTAAGTEGALVTGRPSHDVSPCRPRLARLAWLALGVTALVLGTVGIVLPLLPTTPFAILAAFAFSRSAPSLHARLARSRTFGPAIADWNAHGAIAPRYKRLALAVMAGALGLSVALSLPLPVLAVQAVCMAAAAAFILSRPGQSA